MHRFEPPDLYIIRMNGDVSADDMRMQIDALRAIAQRTGGGVFWLCDVTQMGALSPEARRTAAEASKKGVQDVLRGSAVFGASFATRVMVGLMVRAVRILKPGKHRPLAFVETEAEARAFLDEQRKRGAGS
jgi:hypothetical protein